MNKRRRQRVETRKLWDEDPKRIPLQKSRKRALILNTIIIFSFTVIAFRLIDLMIFDHEKLSGRAEQQYIREKTLRPQRGVIWDRNMREMATNLETDSLFAVPSKIDNTKYISSKLGPVIKVSSRGLQMKLMEKRNKDFVWIIRKMDGAMARKVRFIMDKYGESELGFVTETKRYYPKGQTASHIMGFTDIDDRGIAGLELRYNEYLTGEGKNVFVRRDAGGKNLSEGVKEAVSGNNILLTIDEGLQYIVERELSAAMKEWKAKAAVAIMMNPQTGEILALANRPTYNPNIRKRAPSPRNEKAFEKYWGKRRNRAITDLYEPGSTIKAVLAATALEEGIAGLDEEFDVSKGFIVVGGKPVRDTHKHEILTLSEVIKKSSNVGAVQIGLKLGAKTYDSYLRKFGFGEKTGIDFPGERSGALRKRQDWSGTSLAALSIGQEIGVTPLQILRAYAAIANGGALMKPYIVSEVISPSGKIVKKNVPHIEKRVISPITAERVKGILKTVVEEGGTARRASIQGNMVAGKTGTAQIFDPKTGRYSKKKYVSSFVGFAPADDPKISLIVVIYEPDGATYGGVVAAPVFKNIIEHTFAYLDVPMERDENKVYLVSNPR